MAGCGPRTARARASHITLRIGRMQTSAAHTSALSAPKSSLMAAHAPKLAHANPKTVELRGSTGALATSRGTKNPKARPPMRPPTTVSAKLEEPSLTRAGPTKQPRAQARFNVSRRSVPPKTERTQHSPPATALWQAEASPVTASSSLAAPATDRLPTKATTKAASAVPARAASQPASPRGWFKMEIGSV